MADGSARPDPLALTSRAAEIAHYSAVADALGFLPGDLIRERIVEHCVASRIPVYADADVDRYVQQLTQHIGRGLEWHPLRAKDAFGSSPYWQPGVLKEPYSGLVPREHLANALKILEAFPDVKFFVAAINRNPDPFIGAWLETMTRPVLFGMWDEPGFGEVSRVL